MDKFSLKKRIKELILSDSELKEDYDILLKNKIGYMTNKIHEYNRHKDKYVQNVANYFIENSDANTKQMYSNIINHKLKSRLGNVSDSEFRNAMHEVLDDLSNGD